MSEAEVNAERLRDLQNAFDGSSLVPDRRSFLGYGLSSLLLSTILSGCGDDQDGAPAVGATPPPPATISSFGLAVLPDTQFYSRYATAETGNQFARRYGSEPFLAQTNWIAANAAQLRIPFVIHLGDVVDQATRPQQWAVADTAMKALEDAKIPYSILAGNHDVRQDIGYNVPADQATGTDAARDLAVEPYLQTFGRDRASRQATFGGRDASGFHEYHTFTAEGQRFMVLSMSWRASDAAIAWARGVIAANPTLPVILVNHDLLAIANDGLSPRETSYGDLLWQRLIRDNDQIFMTLNGHYHGSSRLTKLNDFGNAVEQMVVDYQMAYQGGNALMRFYEIDLTNNRINAITFSPWVRQKPGDSLNAFDQPVLTEPNHQFSISMDFARRFARFSPDFRASSAATAIANVAPAASALITNGFAAPAPIVSRTPAGPDDYPRIPETRAHWRFFGGANGTAVSEGAVIEDRSGNGNAIRRAGLNQPAGNTAALDDLVWTDDRHRLSSAPGSIAFRNTRGPRLSYFLTAADAAINAETFTSGYTVEAFMKVPAAWTAANNSFMAMMSRAGRRGNLSGFAGGLPQSPPLQFAFSNLREVQFEIIPEQAPPRSSRVNWSGEIVLDTWIHVAVVGDATTRETTMYVEGAPVLRNAIDTVGLATLGLPWTVGAGYWDGGPPGGGFLGSLGEIRIVARPLTPAQWLTGRAS
ncbi:LamG-like jellyroll fold domain-containing protein [uncultured Sphingomonas sp.]|uniref:LamG-like jellyroll fold domain-containing protein n=1 Tax=uncultured Sphingomonas sp. TaxID=158754 RepID=UPI0035CAC468